MNRRLVEQATHPARLATIEAELTAADPDWSRHVAATQGAATQGKEAAHGNAASYARLDRNESFGKLSIEPGDGLTTRLGARDRIATFPAPQPGPFGTAMTALRLPAYWWPDCMPDDAEPIGVVCAEEEITFCLGAREFRYDRFELRPCGAN